MGGSGSGREPVPKLPSGKYRLWGSVVSSEQPRKKARSDGNVDDATDQNRAPAANDVDGATDLTPSTAINMTEDNE